MESRSRRADLPGDGLVKAGRGAYSAEHHLGVEAGALYWHFVDAVWVVLFTVLYIL